MKCGSVVSVKCVNDLWYEMMSIALNYTMMWEMLFGMKCANDVCHEMGSIVYKEIIWNEMTLNEILYPIIIECYPMVYLNVVSAHDQYFVVR